MPGDRVSQGRHYFSCGDTILACYDALADCDPARVGPNPQPFYFSVDDLEAVVSQMTFEERPRVELRLGE